MEFRILGPVEAIEGSRSLSLGGAKQQALLAVLVLNANRAVSTDRLIDALWGERAPDGAAHTVQVFVSQFRKAFRVDGSSDELLVTQGRGYVLRTEPERVDLYRFEALIDRGRKALADRDPAGASALLREALDLWRGAPLAGLEDEPFAQPYIARIEDVRLSAVEDLIEAELAMGRHAELVGELQSLASEFPLRERLRGQLMLALYRSGRQAEALSAYRDAKRMLAEELGIDPTPDLQRLEGAILRQDPDLELAPQPVRPLPPEPQEVRKAPSREKRKTVTVLFSDLTGSTALGEAPDPERLRSLLAGYFDRMKAIVERHGGTVERFIGDTMMAVFGVPVLHEDDALRAVRAAVEMQDALPELGLKGRIGVMTGEVVTGTERLATGDAVNVAARLEQAAQPGEV